MKHSSKSVAVVCFKRWSNRAFAVFNSLKFEVKIGVLLVVYMFALPSESVFASIPEETIDAKNDEEINLDEVVVSAQRSTATYADIARVVSVISKNEIEQAGVQSINELLEYALGVDVRQRGQHGVQADITMRGGTFDQVLILLNGVNISDPQSGHHHLNLPISLDAIERVEVVAGATSRVYGPNALAGVVNFITGTYDENVSIVKLVAGQHQLHHFNMTTTLQWKKSRHLLSLGYKSSNGYIANSDFKTMNGFYQGQWKTQKGKYDVQIGRTSRNFGANTFYSPAFPNQYEDVQTTFVSAKATIEGKVRFTPTVYYRRQSERFELFRNWENAASWYKHHNYHLSNVYGVNLNLAKVWKLGKTALGTDFRSENILSNVLGHKINPIRVHGEANAFYNKEYHRNNLSMYLEHTVNFWSNRIHITGGIMANKNEDFDGVEYFPGIDVGMKIVKHLKLYGTANRSVRIPTFTDLFYISSKQEGNPNLKPEESTSYESGFKWLSVGVDAHASVFYRQGKNLIDWTKFSNAKGEKWKSRNLANIDIWGMEFAFNLRPFLWSKSWDFLKKISLSYGYTNVERPKKKYISAYVLDNLKHKFDSEITIRPFSKFLLSVHASWQDRDGAFSYYVSKDDAYEKPYDPFWLVNSKLTWKQARYELFVEVANLLDYQYYDIGNVIQPGRWVSGGVKFQLYWR